MSAIAQRPPAGRPARGEDIGEAAAHTDDMWLAVVQRMDEVYAELIGQQVELEARNREVEEARAFTMGVLDTMGEMVIVCDTGRIIERTNAAVDSIFGTDPGAMTGRRIDDLLDPDGAAAVVSEIDAAIAARRQIRDREMLFAAPDGPLPFEVNGTPRQDRRGRAAGIVLVARPVGELRRAYGELAAAHRRLQEAQAQLIQSEKMASLGRLVAGVAHELNNPIAFVYGNTHTLGRYGERLKTYLDAIHAGADTATIAEMRQSLRIDYLLGQLQGTVEGMVEGAERVRDIVADLRLFASGRRSDDETFDLEPVVRSALAWVRRTPGPDVTVSVDLAGPLDIRGHAGQMHQVIMNVIQNAFDAMADCPDRRLTIEGGRQESRIRLTIRDNGPGIADTALTRMFDPFFTTKSVGKGMGLGLSISYGIMADHGGRISAENHAGGGAAVTLDLPAASPGSMIAE